MPKECLICQRIAAIKQHENRYFVRELATGYVVLADSQYFEGYTLFLGSSMSPSFTSWRRRPRSHFSRK